MRFVVVFLLMCGTAHAACNEDIVQVKEWSVSPAGEGQNLTISYVSKADKPIRMLDASAVFEDTLGKMILAFNLDRDGTITPGEQMSTERKLPKNDTYDRLKVVDHSDVKASVCVRGVVYEDGSKEGFK
nr:MAG TPA: hypothetical protein [Caudoviricetes sp.]